MVGDAGKPRTLRRSSPFGQSGTSQRAGPRGPFAPKPVALAGRPGLAGHLRMSQTDAASRKLDGPKGFIDRWRASILGRRFTFARSPVRQVANDAFGRPSICSDAFERACEMIPRIEFDPNAPVPLSGLRVVDLSRLVAGNMVSLQLADQGAEVIKIEDPTIGDPLQRVAGQGPVAVLESLRP